MRVSGWVSNSTRTCQARCHRCKASHSRVVWYGASGLVFSPTVHDDTSTYVVRILSLLWVWSKCCRYRSSWSFIWGALSCRHVCTAGLWLSGRHTFLYHLQECVYEWQCGVLPWVCLKYSSLGKALDLSFGSLLLYQLPDLCVEDPKIGSV